MKRFSLICVLLFCLMLAASVLAEENSQGEEELSELQITLNEYKEDGYSILGPVRYLGRTQDKVMLYRNRPASYRILDTMDEDRDFCFVKKHDSVFVLSKHGHVVLIRISREDKGNV